MKIQSLYHDDAEGALYVRWRMCATPRWLASRSRLVVDGLSLYRLDTRGLVCEHSLENNARRRDHVRPLFEGVLSKVGAKGSVVGAGAGVPGWYRTVLEPVDLVTFPNRTHVEETTTDVNEQAAMEQDINVMSFL